MRLTAPRAAFFKSLTATVPQSVQERRQWKKFGEAANEKVGDSVTMRATEEIPFERVRLAKTTQEQKTQMDVATALAMGDKAAVGTRCGAHPLPLHSWAEDACYWYVYRAAAAGV